MPRLVVILIGLFATYVPVASPGTVKKLLGEAAFVGKDNPV